VDGRQVRELFSHLAEFRLPEGMILSTGAFTPDAELFARQNRITLVAGGELIARFNRLPQMVRARILTDVTAGDFTTPSCPRCNEKLVAREKGTDGVLTWGCRRFPQCRYTMKSQLELAVG
jgi:restriction system protein